MTVGVKYLLLSSLGVHALKSDNSFASASVGETRKLCLTLCTYFYHHLRKRSIPSNPYGITTPTYPAGRAAVDVQTRPAASASMLSKAMLITADLMASKVVAGDYLCRSGDNRARRSTVIVYELVERAIETQLDAHAYRWLVTVIQFKGALGQMKAMLPSFGN